MLCHFATILLVALVPVARLKSASSTTITTTKATTTTTSSTRRTTTKPSTSSSTERIPANFPPELSEVYGSPLTAIDKQRQFTGGFDSSKPEEYSLRVVAHLGRVMEVTKKGAANPGFQIDASVPENCHFIAVSDGQKKSVLQFDENSTLHVHGDKIVHITNNLIIMENGVSSALFRTYEPDCYLAFPKGASNTSGAFNDYTAAAYQSAGYALTEKNEVKLPLRPYYVNEQSVLIEDRKKSLLSSTDFVDKKTKVTRVDCWYQCYTGLRLGYDLQAESAKFLVDVELNRECEWFKLCLAVVTSSTGQPECYELKAAEFHLKRGFVLMPNQVQGVPMDMRTLDGRYTAPNADTLYKINIEYDGKLMVRNMLGELLVSKELTTTQEIMFVFANGGCLARAPAFVGYQPFGQLIAHPEDEKAPRLYNKPNNFGPKPTPPPKNDVQIANVTDAEKDERLTTTATTIPKLDDDTTTTLDPSATADLSDQVYELAEKIAEKENADKGKGWQTWAVFYGFATGAMISYAIGALLLFICRRSFYVFWYREMYNRYGSDVTGDTTMAGATEACSTIGDVTTTTTTVGDTTGGNTTTAGSVLYG